MKVAFLCINYNNAWITTNFVLNALSLRGADERVACVVVVDNGSREDDYGRLSADLDGIERACVVRLENNVGYSMGINAGLLRIYENFDVDYIVGGNNDLIFEIDFLERLEQARYADDHYLVVPDLVTLEGSHQNPDREDAGESPLKDKAVGFLLTHPPVGNMIIALRSWRKKPSPKLEQSKCIHIPVGACFIFTRAYKEHCTFIPDVVFMWAEENVIAEHVRRMGGQVYYDASLIVHHFESASVASVPSKEARKMLKDSYLAAERYVNGRN